MISETFERPDGMSDEQWHELLQAILARAENVTPVRTGRLRDGWNIDDNGDEATLENDVPYAEYINGGTPRIRPFNMIGKAMALLRGR